MAESLMPPEGDGRALDALGISTAEVRAFAIVGLTRRVKLIGVPIATL